MLVLLVGRLPTESCAVGPVSVSAIVSDGARALMDLRVNYSGVRE
jgi:hypothetical protein